jgi:squalene monooxygenase
MTVMTRTTYDTAVVGAGPIGCAAAIAFARGGRRVLLLEANPRTAGRFAGEWIHPTGVQVLNELGLTSLKAASESGPGHGFVVHPDDGGDPIALPYPDGTTAISFEHGALVEELRSVARDTANIDYVAPARVFKLDADLHYHHTGKASEVKVAAERIIAADGRRSALRRMIGVPDVSRGLSFMGGIALHNLDLPVEGFGHMIVGGPGPILLYRIGSNTTRMAIDVPADAGHLRRDMNSLFAAVAPVLPPAVAKALATALKAGKPAWMRSRFMPRTDHARGSVALVGDAAGCVHPLSAAGISLGLMDVRALAQCTTLRQYSRRRKAEARVPELLSNALYDVFSSGEADAMALRKSIYDTWRSSPKECQRAMRMLAGMDTHGTSFAAAFTKIGLKAAGAAIKAQLSQGRWTLAGHTAASFLPWSTWSLAGVVPGCRKYPKRRTTPELLADQ